MVADWRLDRSRPCRRPRPRLGACGHGTRTGRNVGPKSVRVRVATSKPATRSKIEDEDDDENENETLRPPNCLTRLPTFLQGLSAITRSRNAPTSVHAMSWARLGARFNLANERAAIGSISLISGSVLSGASPHQISRQTAQPPTPNAKHRTPNAKRRTPNAKRQTPNAKRYPPTLLNQTFARSI